MLEAGRRNVPVDGRLPPAQLLGAAGGPGRAAAALAIAAVLGTLAARLFALARPRPLLAVAGPRAAPVAIPIAFFVAAATSLLVLVAAGALLVAIALPLCEEASTVSRHEKPETRATLSHVKSGQAS